MHVVRQAGQVVLYRFPEGVTNALAELTPQRPDLCRERISAIADGLISLKEVSERYKWGGVQAALLIIRGHALNARTQNESKELYYWLWHEG